MATSSKHLLLVYCDLLGDYLIFRHQLRALKPLLESRFDKITWVCNATVLPLATHLADDLPHNIHLIPISQFELLSLTPKKLLTLPLKAGAVRQHLQSLGVPFEIDEVWCPSLAPWVMNQLSFVPKAKRKLGRDVEDKTFRRLQKLVFNELYSPANFYEFVAYQHRAFFEKALGQSLDMPERTFPVEAIAGSFEHPVLSHQPYVVMFPDSMGEHKQWPPQRFAQLANAIYRETGLAVVLAGSKRGLANTIQIGVNDEVSFFNLVGKTSIIQALEMIRQSQMVICNDSFAMHAANTLAKPFICLTSGLFEGRYWPYPFEMQQASHHYVLPLSKQHNLSDISIQEVMKIVHQEILHTSLVTTI